MNTRFIHILGFVYPEITRTRTRFYLCSQLKRHFVSPRAAFNDFRLTQCYMNGCCFGIFCSESSQLCLSLCQYILRAVDVLDIDPVTIAKFKKTG